MAVPAQTGKVIRFGVFELDSRLGELRKNGAKLRLQGQPLQVLEILVEHAGDLVGRDTLRERLWPADTFVDFDHSLNNAIARIREALGDFAEQPSFIQTIPRRGYLFLKPVEYVGPSGPTLASQAVPVPEIASPTSSVKPRRVSRTRRVVVLALAAILAGVVGLNLSRLRYRLFGGPSTGRIRSIAVLPLENLSRDPEQEYFAEGITEALITDLGKIGELRVISRTSVMRYKGTKKSLQEIARELQVESLVEGTVTRSGDRVRITANLVQVSPEKHLWADSFERDLRDVLTLQDDVSRAIAKSIQIRLTPQEQVRFASAHRVDPNAYESYLRGLYFWNKRTESALNEAVRYFQQAIEKDPSYAQAYAGLANAYGVQGSWTVEAIGPKEAFSKARPAAEKALELDTTIAEAHAIAAGLKHIYEWDWQGAGLEYRRAIELDPSYAPAHQWYAQYLCELGRFEECIAEAERAHALDPIYVIAGADVGMRLYWARRYHDAIEPLQKTLEFAPDFRIAHRFLGQVYEESQMYKEALGEFHKAVELSQDAPIDLAALGHAYAISGDRTSALIVLQRLKRLGKRRYVSSYDLALVYVGLGEKHRALELLEGAFQERSSWMVHLNVDPRLDSLRDEPRFKDLLRLVGLRQI